MSSSESPARGWPPILVSLCAVGISLYTLLRIEQPREERQARLDQQEEDNKKQQHSLNQQQLALNEHSEAILKQQKTLNDQETVIKELAIRADERLKELAAYDRTIKKTEAAAAQTAQLSGTGNLNWSERRDLPNGVEMYLLNANFTFGLETAHQVTVDAVDCRLYVTEKGLDDLMTGGKDTLLNKPWEDGPLKWRAVFMEKRARQAYLERATSQNLENDRADAGAWKTDVTGWESVLSTFEKGHKAAKSWQVVARCPRLSHAYLVVVLRYWQEGEDGKKIPGWCSYEATLPLSTSKPVGGG